MWTHVILCTFEEVVFGVEEFVGDVDAGIVDLAVAVAAAEIDELSFVFIVDGDQFVLVWDSLIDFCLLVVDERGVAYRTFFLYFSVTVLADFFSTELINKHFRAELMKSSKA
jgi:hypothetical protein